MVLCSACGDCRLSIGAGGTQDRVPQRLSCTSRVSRGVLEQAAGGAGSDRAFPLAMCAWARHLCMARAAQAKTHGSRIRVGRGLAGARVYPRTTSVAVGLIPRLDRPLSRAIGPLPRARSGPPSPCSLSSGQAADTVYREKHRRTPVRHRARPIRTVEAPGGGRASARRHLSSWNFASSQTPKARPANDDSLLHAMYASYSGLHSSRVNASTGKDMTSGRKWEERQGFMYVHHPGAWPSVVPLRWARVSPCHSHHAAV